jgi:hypothetical protein
MTARKPIMALEAEAEEPEMQALTAHDGVPLKRSLSAVNLVSLYTLLVRRNDLP